MAIARVQKKTATLEGGTSISVAFDSSVTAGNLIVVMCTAGSNTSSPGGPFVAGDCTKSAGTATVGTVTIDKQLDDTVTGGYQSDGIWSVPVTGSGTCTMQVANFTSGSWATLEIVEYSGADVTSSRVAATNGASGTSSAAASGNAASGMAGVFCGVLGVYAGGTVTLTQDGAFSLLDEYEDGSTHEVSSYIERIVSSDTTDSADWTLGSSQDWCACVAVYKQASGDTYGTPYDHSGTKPWSFIWRPGRI